MTKIYFKLIVMALALALSVTVVIMSSYAWMVLSSNPVATGIQVAIGGGNTILIASNVQEEAADGTVYNYPGYFSDSLNFGMQKEYSYLQNLAGLTPVSTSNGIDWFLSEKDIDSELSHANLSKDSEEDAEKLKEGSYIYLDFWVVSPSGDYTLRISTGDEESDGGSFVVDLLEPETDGENYTLTQPKGSAAASVRIGFLANDVTLTDETMLQYKESTYFDDRFTALRGMYQEPESGTPYLSADRFTIFEPNGDYHPGDEDIDGSYVKTEPLALEDGQTVKNSDIWDSLTVQLSSTWSAAANGDGTGIEQQFNAAQRVGDWSELTPADVISKFYFSTLQGQIAPYVTKGSFISYSENLKNLMGEGTQISAESLNNIGTSGATEDVYIIKLERNIPQRIRMFIWIEGQDVDCAASADSARFAVNIEFAGGNE